MIRPFERGYDRQAMRCLMMYLSVRCAAYREPLRHECVSLVRSVSDVSEVSLAPLHVGQLCVRERWVGARRVVVSCGVRCVKYGLWTTCAMVLQPKGCIRMLSASHARHRAHESNRPTMKNKTRGQTPRAAHARSRRRAFDFRLLCLCDGPASADGARARRTVPQTRTQRPFFPRAAFA